MNRIEAKERFAKHVTANRLGVFDCGWDVIDLIFDDNDRCDNQRAQWKGVLRGYIDEEAFEALEERIEGK